MIFKNSEKYTKRNLQKKDTILFMYQFLQKNTWCKAACLFMRLLVHGFVEFIRN